jgi:hypothetical protein
MSASFPTSVKTFTSRSAGQAIGSAHINDLQDEVAAVETVLLPIYQGQIAFPAVQSPSAGANVLDDYEEGTWTVIIGGSGGQSGQTYTFNTGVYVKIGKIVIATFDVGFSVLGTITGNVQIQGFPFTAAADGGLGTICRMSWSAFTTSYVDVSGYMTTASNVMGVFGLTAAGTGNTPAALVQGNLSNSSVLRGTVIYRADA